MGRRFGVCRRAFDDCGETPVNRQSQLRCGHPSVVDFIHGIYIRTLGVCRHLDPFSHEVVKTMKEGFYGFFLPAVISDRRSAISAIAAGAIAGSLLTLVTGVAAVYSLSQSSGRSEATVLLVSAALVAVIVTIGKRILSAAILGLVEGAALLAWAAMRGQLTAAIVLAVPLVGGLLTASRGIVILKRLQQSQ
jgi:hypothetical protein